MINEPAVERKNPLWELATEYLSHLQFERRLSNNTLYAYSLDLKKYTHFLFSELHLTSINSIKASHIENFVNDLNYTGKMDRKSNFKMLKWIPYYIYWLLYSAIKNYILKIKN